MVYEISSRPSAGVREPFDRGPDVVCEPCGHGRGSGFPATVGSLDTQRSDRPAEVVAECDEERGGVVYFPVLREAVALPRFAGVLPAVGAVVALDEGGVDGRAGRRARKQEFQ